jgi:hypothetical protein
MNVTLMLQRSISAAFRKMYDGFATQTHSPAVPVRGDLYCRATIAKAPVATAWRPETKRCQPQKAKPLRVLRYVEGGLPRASVGRMVMSGSMADVCAELDRLAAQEITLH